MENASRGRDTDIPLRRPKTSCSAPPLAGLRLPTRPKTGGMIRSRYHRLSCHILTFSPPVADGHLPPSVGLMHLYLYPRKKYPRNRDHGSSSALSMGLSHDVSRCFDSPRVCGDVCWEYLYVGSSPNKRITVRIEPFDQLYCTCKQIYNYQSFQRGQ